VDEFIIGRPLSSDGKKTPQSNNVWSVTGRLDVRATEGINHLEVFVCYSFL